jgi:hypothetical protein
MGRFRKRLKKVAKKFGRVVGGPITQAVDAGRRVRNESGRKDRARTFFRELMTGSPPDASDTVGAVHDLAAESTDQVLDAAGAPVRARGLGSIIRATGRTPQQPSPNVLFTEEARIAVNAGRHLVDGNTRQAIFKLLQGVGLPVTATADEAALWLANNYSAVVSSFGLEEGAVPLPDNLKPFLRRIFGNTIRYDNVRIKSGETAISKINGGRPIAFGDLILLVDDPIENGTTTVDGLDQPGAVLLHEMVHVWQFNVGGPSYMSKALTFQLFTDDQ